MIGVAAAVGGAQLPGAPVLQNAWATPGVVAAFNYAGGSDDSHSPKPETQNPKPSN